MTQCQFRHSEPVQNRKKKEKRKKILLIWYKKLSIKILVKDRWQNLKILKNSLVNKFCDKHNKIVLQLGEIIFLSSLFFYGTCTAV